MKIVEVHTYVLSHDLERPFESATIRISKRQHCLVEIVCDDGTVGWGECLGPALPNAAVVKMYAGALIGRDPLANEILWQELYNMSRDQGQRGLTMTALSGIDIALWDIKGKHFDVPVSVLLGGRFRENIQAYATGGFKQDNIDRIESGVAEMVGFVEDGFHAAKIKIGFDPDKDLKLVAAVRDVMPPEMHLMVDANHGYDALDAIRFGRAAADYEIAWFEEPVSPEQLQAYRYVRAEQPIPVAGGETWHGRYGFKEPLETRAIDIAQPDICGTGGFTEARRVADMAALHGVRLVPHVWGTAIQIAASLQFLAALPPDPPGQNPIEPILELDKTANPFREGILSSALEFDQGVFTVPRGPGLGIEISRSAVEAASI